MIDRDGDGLVDKDELIAYQMRLTEHNHNQQTQRVFEKNDEDEDGMVTLAEVWVHSEEGENCLCSELSVLTESKCTMASLSASFVLQCNKSSLTLHC